MIAAILLAAGLSRRMAPHNKLLAALAGRPIIAWAAEAVLASRARPAILVAGRETALALAERPFTVVVNEDPAAGLSRSIRLGLDALPPEAEGAVFCLGDMPRIHAHHIDALIAAFGRSGGAALCIPSRDGRRGNPVLWSRRYFDELRALSGDTGARALIEAHREAVITVPVADDGIFLDVDTPEDLAALQATP